jgi:hypothetical protein
MRHQKQLLYFITPWNILNFIVKEMMETQDVMKDMLLWMKLNNENEFEVKSTSLVIHYFQYTKMYKPNSEHLMTHTTLQ